jgi:hypothetical protein
MPYLHHSLKPCKPEMACHLSNVKPLSVTLPLGFSGVSQILLDHRHSPVRRFACDLVRSPSETTSRSCRRQYYFLPRLSPIPLGVVRHPRFVGAGVSVGLFAPERQPLVPVFRPLIGLSAPAPRVCGDQRQSYCRALASRPPGTSCSLGRPSVPSSWRGPD